MVTTFIDLIRTQILTLMNNVLSFWRDVEIFNIPDAPTAKAPSQSRNVVPADEPEPDVLADTNDPAEEGLDADRQGATPRPRSRVVQRFATNPSLIKDRNAIFPPILPWQEPRFQIPDIPATQEKDSDSNDGPASYAHAVYLGVGPKERFIKFILDTHSILPTDDEIYRPTTGQGWLAAFLVDSDGVPLPKSYVAASFSVGSDLLRENRSLDTASEALRARSAGFDARMDDRRQKLAHDFPQAAPYPLTWDDLICQWEYVHAPLGGTNGVDGSGPLGPFIVVESVPLYRRKDGTFNPPANQAASFLNSFFIDDLTALIQGDAAAFSTALSQYLGTDCPAQERADLLANPKALADQVRPSFIPAGRWPASPKEHLAIAQQAAVYQILHQIGNAEGDQSHGLMAVNGPPGTGKTTLLKDVIAEVVVQRAKRISKLNDPEELFTDRIIQVNGSGEKFQGAPALRGDIVDGTEIVVTSFNNTAVQNISFELPFECDRTAFPDAGYLPEVAMKVTEKFGLKRKENPWGLLSGALGAKPNRDKFATALMGYEPAVKQENRKTHPITGEPSSLKPWLDLARSPAQTVKDWRRHWLERKADFVRRLAEVDAARAELIGVEQAMEELPKIPATRGDLQAQLSEQSRQAQSLQATETERIVAYREQNAHDQAALQNLANCRSEQAAQRSELKDRVDETRDFHNPGWFARSLKKIFGAETQGFKDWKEAVKLARDALEAAEFELRQTTAEHQRIAAQITVRDQQANQALTTFKLQMSTKNSRIAELEQALIKLNEREQGHHERIAALRTSANLRGDRLHLPDDAFMALSPEKQHVCSLWVSDQLDQMRSELFLSALRLHEATLMATAGSWFRVLRVVRDFLSGQAQPKTTEDLAIVWRSLFFVVPVVSTTLASFGRLFQGMERESLGWVLIDEAGQAPAAAVAGALWRARRAVVVGDPLQIEPVVTVPRKLVESLGRNNGMDDATITRWSPSVQSAQTVSDRTMHLGAKIGDVWTGLPLRTHRRCMNPMFDIANRIAYDDQMVQATAPKDVEPDLFASCWIDIQGSANGKVINNEIAALAQILESFLLNWPQIVNSKGERAPASVYVISPFRDVATACKDSVGPDSSLGRRFAKKKLVVGAGTVHTFQGKEASIVFLVLGSAPGDAGAGSRSWAASKPNLLNVAVTRAQQRFYVIGNHVDWSKLQFFSELAEQANRMPRTRIERMPGTKEIRLVCASEAEAIVK